MKKLAIAYYEKLLNGVGRSAALRQTQLEMLAGEHGSRYTYPYFWAAFIPSGDRAPLTNTRN